MKTRRKNLKRAPKPNPAGSKLRKVARASALTLCHRHGIAGLAITNMRRAKDLANIAAKKHKHTV